MNCTVGDIARIMERLAPCETAMSFDNVGLMVGDRSQRVARLMLALDISDAVLSEAAEKEIDLIVTHHPLIFSPLRRVTADDYISRLVLRAAALGISIYSAHTNLDIAAQGVTTALMTRLFPGLAVNRSEDGLVAAVSLPHPIGKDELARHVKSLLGAPALRVSGSRRSCFSRIAVSGGSGHGSVRTALEMDADAFITGEISYHYAAGYELLDMSVIEAGHFYSERPVLEYLARYLQKESNSVEYNLSIDISQKQHSPYLIW